MFKYGIPIILIGIATGGFFMFVNPLYKNIKLLRAEAVSYDEALTNSKALESQRDALTQKYNSISPENLNKLQKLLPDNVDNIRLILEIEKIASPYGMVLKDVKYDTVSKDPAAENPKGNTAKGTNNNYGSWNLEFSTQGSYSNFLNFVKDLEKNLRILDIASVDFSSNTTTGAAVKTNISSDSYKYTFKIKTYWLKG